MFRRLRSTKDSDGMSSSQPRNSGRREKLNSTGNRFASEHAETISQHFLKTQPERHGEPGFGYHPPYRSHPPQPPPNHHYHVTSSVEGYSHAMVGASQEPQTGPPVHHPYYNGMPPTHSNGTHSSSSFESYASSSAAGAPTVVRSNASAPMIGYSSSSSYGPIPTQQQQQHHHHAAFAPYPYYSHPTALWNTVPPPPPPPVEEYALDVNKNDVLCGRGGATNSHSGNRAFRSLVKRYQDRYLRAKKRDKPGKVHL